MENDPPRPSIEYERPSGITRGAFRLLLLLTFLNTILLGINLMGPQSWQAVRSVYTSWKERRANAAALAQRERVQRAGLKAAVAFRFPEKHVAYTEVPEEAMALVSQGLPYNPASPTGDGTAPPRWQAPVAARPPPALGRHEPLATEGLLFLHERKSPNGTTLLVLVVVRASYEFHNETSVINNNTADRSTFYLSRQRQLQCVAFKPEANGDVTVERRYHLDLILPDAQRTPIATMTTPRRGPAPATVAVERGHQLRLFGGSPNPADPSHFTIPYELDGQPGVIDGWLHDDALLLRPRQGRALPSVGEPAWELPTTAPTTAPVVTPR